mmetsp:Transcript_1470/g.2096  ORF Transcript_1470/g.2096 Transcript_1470/m.2096 type:complete len:194 (-) Transcript_1470:189-770(-)
MGGDRMAVAVCFVVCMAMQGSFAMRQGPIGGRARAFGRARIRNVVPRPFPRRFGRQVHRPRPTDCRCETGVAGGVIDAAEAGIITITPNAEKRIAQLRPADSPEGAELYLRMGVTSGGCSGMSYIMNVIEPEKIEGDDTIVKYDGFNCVIDAKSLLYIFGMTLDFSDELIGGGFKFFNPNAKDTCGCGTSFGV